jgi:membrane-associated phospholipid phosphatase
MSTKSTTHHRYTRLAWAILGLLPVILLADAPLRVATLRLAPPPLILRITTELGNGAVDLMLALLLLLLNRRAGRAALASVAVGGVAVNVLKYTIGRARPYAAATPWVFLGPTVHGNYGSFPSGHTTTAVALAAVAAAAYPRLRLPLFCLATLVGFSRVAIDMHWPSDILAGAALGVFVAAWQIRRQEIMPHGCCQLPDAPPRTQHQ